MRRAFAILVVGVLFTKVGQWLILVAHCLLFHVSIGLILLPVLLLMIIGLASTSLAALSPFSQQGAIGLAARAAGTASSPTDILTLRTPAEANPRIRAMVNRYLRQVKVGRKQGRTAGRKEERKEGRRERRKDGRKKGMKEGTKRTGEKNAGRKQKAIR